MLHMFFTLMCFCFFTHIIKWCHEQSLFFWEESSVAKGKDKSRRCHGYKVPPGDNAKSFNLQHMGVTLTGITRIKGPTNKVGGNAGGGSAPE